MCHLLGNAFSHCFSDTHLCSGKHLSCSSLPGQALSPDSAAHIPDAYRTNSSKSTPSIRADSPSIFLSPSHFPSALSWEISFAGTPYPYHPAILQNVSVPAWCGAEKDAVLPVFSAVPFLSASKGASEAAPAYPCILSLPSGRSPSLHPGNTPV